MRYMRNKFIKSHLIYPQKHERKDKQQERRKCPKKNSLREWRKEGRGWGSPLQAAFGDLSAHPASCTGCFAEVWGWWGEQVNLVHDLKNKKCEAPVFYSQMTALQIMSKCSGLKQQQFVISYDSTGWSVLSHGVLVKALSQLEYQVTLFTFHLGAPLRLLAKLLGYPPWSLFM